MARIIVFTSGKGGVGKTTVVSCLGRCLALKNYKVVLIDADLGLKNLDVVMGLESRIVFDLEDVIKGRASLKQALVQDKMSPNLFLLPACIRIDVKTVDETYMTSIINQLQSDFDFILIDSPAGIEQGFNNAIKNAQEAIVVMTLDKASLRDADKVVGILKNRNFEKIHLLINKYNPKSNRFLSIEEATRVLAIPVAGVIEDEKEIVKVQNFGLFLNNGGSAFRAFDELAISISGRKLEKKNTLSFLKFIKKNTKS